MAKRIAVVSGTALAPGVSKNGRLYTLEGIAKAVSRAQERVNSGTMALRDRRGEVQPFTQRTHHDAEDDTTALVGRVSSLTLAEDGSAKFTADIADTSTGRDIAALADTSDGRPAFLRGVSIRGAWVGGPTRVIHDGQPVETGDLELYGLDYTSNPGVAGAVIDSCLPVNESDTAGRTEIYESVQEAQVTTIREDTDGVVEKGAAPLKSGKPAAPPTKASHYADPGYQGDKAKRYALDTKKQAMAAWSYINQAKNASNYTAAQLKRIKGRIKAALKRFGVNVTDEGWVIDPVTQVTETESSELAEYYGDASSAGTFRIELTNGPTTVTVCSYSIDPADLDLVGHAAMAGACQALKALDPDMDADIDVPGSSTADDTGESARPGALTINERTINERAEESPPVTGQAADPDNPEEEPDVSEPTEPAVEPQTPAVPDQPTTEPVEPASAPPEPDAGQQSVTMTNQQFEQLLAALQRPAMAGAETAPAPVAATRETTAPAAVESQEQMIARLVAEGVKAALPLAVQEHVQATGVPGRKGLVAKVAETDPATPAGDTNSHGLPADWPDKPLHLFTDAERRQYVYPQVQQHVLGSRAEL